MLGAICGDVIGSVHEFHNCRSRDFPLFTRDNILTDDTVCTIAIADCFLNDSRDFATYLRKYCAENIHAGYGGMFRGWILDSTMGPYDSWGNGGAMRVSSVANVAETLEEALVLAEETCMVTHSHSDGIAGAQAIITAMFDAKENIDPAKIRANIEREFGYDLSKTTAELCALNLKFDVSAKGSVPLAITAALESVDFEDAMRGAISIGGDSDTIAAMAGGIAEIMHGIPEDIKEETRNRLPVSYHTVIDNYYDRFIYN